MKVLTILLVLVVATPTMAAHRSFSGGYPSSAAQGIVVEGDLVIKSMLW